LAVTFSLAVTADDVVATELYRVAHSGAARFQRWFWLSLAGFVATLVVLDLGRHGLNVSKVAGGVLAMLVMIWVPSRQSLIWRIRQRIKRFPALTEAVSVTVDEDGLTLAAGQAATRVERRLMWHALIDIDLTSAHLFLRFSPGPMIVCLPRRGLPEGLEGELLQRRKP
jgi:hypothetical protein